MKFFNWFKRNKMPRLNKQTQELFEVAGVTSTEEWQAIDVCFDSSEVPPPELIVAAFQAFLKQKDRYLNGLTEEAYTLREDIVLTITAMQGEENE